MEYSAIGGILVSGIYNLLSNFGVRRNYPAWVGIKLVGRRLLWTGFVSGFLAWITLK
jgi:hypothetical protein